MGENSVKKYLSTSGKDGSESVSRAVGVRSVTEYLDGSGDKTQNLSIYTNDDSILVRLLQDGYHSL